MGRRNVNSGSLPAWIPQNAASSSLGVISAIENLGIKKVANEAGRLAVEAPVEVNGVIPELWIYQEDIEQFYRYNSTTNAWVPFFPATGVRLPSPALSTYAIAEDTSLTDSGQGNENIERSSAAIAHPATLGQATTHIAVDLGRGYPREVDETRTDGSIRTHAISPLVGTLTGENRFLLFRLATPLEEDSRQAFLTIRGSTINNARPIPDIGGGTTTSTGGAGYLPDRIGAPGTSLFVNTAGTAMFFAPINLQTIFGAGIGTPQPGDALTYGASGWELEAKATGVPISSGTPPRSFLSKASATITLFRGIEWQDIFTPTATIPTEKLPDFSGNGIGAVMQIADLGGGMHGWRVQQPVFVVPDNSVTAPKLDAGDDAKALALRTRLGFPTGMVAGQFLRAGTNDTLVAGYNHFPSPNTLELPDSTRTAQIQAILQSANQSSFQLVDSDAIPFMSISHSAQLTTPYSDINTASGEELRLTSTGLQLNAGTGPLNLAAGGLQVGGVSIKPGQAIGAAQNGSIAGLSIYQPVPTRAHWSATLTVGSGAGGDGYESVAGSTFGGLNIITFVWQGTTYTVRNMLQDPQHAVKIHITPDPGTVDTGWSFTVGAYTLNVSDAQETVNSRYGVQGREYLWANQPSNFFPASGQSELVYLNHELIGIPIGGTANQHLAKNAANDGYIWVDPPTGGGGGTPGTPGAIYEAIAAASLASGSYRAGQVQQLALTSTSVDSGSGISISNNRINIAAGTAERVYSVETTLEIDPTSWQNSRQASGNRLFFEVHAQKNGVEIDGTRSSDYFRGDEDWTPGEWHFQMDFAVVLDGGDYLTIHIERVGPYGIGAEINAFQVVAANSQVHVITQAAGSGGGSGGGGSSTLAGLTDVTITSASEHQIIRQNAAGQWINDDLGDVLDLVSDAGRDVLYDRTGRSTGYASAPTQVVLPANYASYDELIVITCSTSTEWRDNIGSDTRTISTQYLARNASITNINGSRMDWTRSNRIFGAGNTPDRILYAALVRGQGRTGPAGNDGAGTTLSSAIPARPTLTGTPGTSPDAPHADHAHPAELRDDVITPAMLQADTSGQKLAIRNRIGVVEGAGAFVFNNHTLTVADDPDESGDDRGYESTGPAYGVAAPRTYVADAVTYTFQALRENDNNDLVMTITPAPPTTGAGSSLNWGLLIADKVFWFKDAQRVGDSSYGTLGTTYTWFGQGGVIPAVGTTIPFSIVGPVGRELARIETALAAHRQVPAYPASPNGTRYLNDQGNWTVPADTDLIDYQSVFILNVPTATVSNTNHNRIPLALSSIEAGSGLSLTTGSTAGNLTIARPGTYFLDWWLNFTNPSDVQTLWKFASGRNIPGAFARLYTDSALRRDQLKGFSMVQTTTANEVISLWWEPLELTSAGTVPPSPTAIGAPLTILPGPPPHINITWTYSSSTRVDTWELQWSLAGENNWQPWASVPNNAADTIRDTTLHLHHTNPIDIRVRGRNSAGPGSYAQRTNAGVFSQQAVPSQTVRATGGVIVRSIDT